MAKIVNLFGETEDEDLLEADEGPSAPAVEVSQPAPPNAVTTRGRERMVEQVPGTPEPTPALQLLSVFGSDGKVRVALAVNGERIEEWRQPTEKEWEQLRARGRIIRGGIGQVPEAAPAPVAPPAAPPSTGLPLGKLLLGGLALIGVGGAAYFWWQNKQMAENTEEVE